MQTVLIVIHLLIVVALVAVVLLQRSEGGALGVGGGSGFMTGRGQANVLTRATAILATLFFLTSLGLTLIARYGHQNLNFTVPNGAAEQAPKLPPTQSKSILDQVRAIEEQRNGAPAPAGGAASPAPAPVTAAKPAQTTPPPAEPSGMPDRVAPNAVKPVPPAAPAK